MKPGYKTTEFWMACAAVLLGGFVASGVQVEDNVSQWIGTLQTMFITLGYTGSRLSLKKEVAKSP